MSKRKYPKLTIENCGRWFDDYVLVEVDGKLHIESEAKNLPRSVLKSCRKSPFMASAILEIYSEKDREFCKKIQDKGQISREEYEFIMSQI